MQLPNLIPDHSFGYQRTYKELKREAVEKAQAEFNRYQRTYKELKLLQCWESASDANSYQRTYKELKLEMWT